MASSSWTLTLSAGRTMFVRKIHNLRSSNALLRYILLKEKQLYHFFLGQGEVLQGRIFKHNATGKFISLCLMSENFKVENILCSCLPLPLPSLEVGHPAPFPENYLLPKFGLRVWNLGSLEVSLH